MVFVMQKYYLIQINKRRIADWNEKLNTEDVSIWKDSETA